jgi:adenine-specific DNA-methyltransferase
VDPLAHGIVAWHQQLASASEATVHSRPGGFANDVAENDPTAIHEQHGLKNVRNL